MSADSQDGYAKEYTATVWWHVRTFLRSDPVLDSLYKILIGAAIMFTSVSLLGIMRMLWEHTLTTPLLIVLAWGIGWFWKKRLEFK